MTMKQWLSTTEGRTALLLSMIVAAVVGGILLVGYEIGVAKIEEVREAVLHNQAAVKENQRLLYVLLALDSTDSVRKSNDGP